MRIWAISFVGVFFLIAALPDYNAGKTAPAAGNEGRTRWLQSGPNGRNADGLLNLRAFRLSESRAPQARQPDRISTLQSLNDTAATRAVLTPQRSHSGSVNSVAFSLDGRLLVSGGGDRTLRLWDVATASLIRVFSGHVGPVGAVAFSPDGRSILSGSQDHTLRLWQTASGELVREFKTRAPITSVAFSPDGHRILSASTDGILDLWDAGSEEAIRKFGVDAGKKLFAAFSPDGRWIASEAAPGSRLVLWDAASGALIREIKVDPGWHGFAFSPDGRQIAAGSGAELKLFNTLTGRPVRTFTSEPRSGARIVVGEDRGWNISSVAFSPDGQRLVFNGVVFSVATGKQNPYI